MMGKRAVVLAAVPVDPVLKRYIHAGDFVLACDAGYQNAVRLGVTPDLLIGDFDSMPQPKTAIPTITLPTVKDDTDTHHAARWLLERGYHDVTLLGALGGARLDQTLASIATGLYLAQNGAEVRLADDHTELRYLLPGQPLTLTQDAERPWRFFSVFPLDGGLSGVDIVGAKYPLQDAALTPDFPLGVSNEFVDPLVTVRCAAGHGLVLLTR